MLDTTTTMFLVFGAIVISLIIDRKAQNALTKEQKIALMESSPKIPWTLILIAVAYGIHAWLSERFGHSATFLGGFMLILIGVVFLSFFMMFRRSQKLGLPPIYLRTFMTGQIIVLLALVVMCWSYYSEDREIDATTQKLLNETTRTN